MATWINFCKTDQGKLLDAKVSAGKTLLNITKSMSAAGKVSSVQLHSLTELPEPKQTLQLSEAMITQAGTAITLPIKLSNKGLEKGYTMYLLGIFARDPDLGEVLYMVSQTSSESGEEIPPEAVQPAFSIQWNHVIKTDDVANVIIEVSEAGLLTAEQANATYALKSQANTYTMRFKDVTIVTSEWAEDNTFSDYPYKALIEVAGVTEAGWACKNFTPDHTDRSLDSLFFSTVFVGDNVFAVWAEAIPDHDIVIENISLEKVVE